jgi:hypothetical protein
MGFNLQIRRYHGALPVSSPFPPKLQPAANPNYEILKNQIRIAERMDSYLQFLSI